MSDTVFKREENGVCRDLGPVLNDCSPYNFVHGFRDLVRYERARSCFVYKHHEHFEGIDFRDHFKEEGTGS